MKNPGSVMKRVTLIYVLANLILLGVALLGCGQEKLVTHIPEEVTCEVNDYLNGFMFECTNGILIIVDDEKKSVPKKCGPKKRRR